MIRFEPVPHRKLVAHQLIWFALWAAVTTVGACLTPSPNGHGTHTELGLPPCPSVLLFNRPCPGCGLTTSWTAFIHGQFATAFKAHPLGPFLYLGFTFVGIGMLVSFLKCRRFDAGDRRLTKLVGAGVVGFVLFGAVRFAISPNYGRETPAQLASAAHGAPAASIGIATH